VLSAKFCVWQFQCIQQLRNIETLLVHVSTLLTKIPTQCGPSRGAWFRFYFCFPGGD
jgi:hypothetical protein